MPRKTTYSSEVDQTYKLDKGRKRPKYRQGIYKPINPHKCINCKEGKPVEFRSKLEFEYMHLIDKSDKVISWGSEYVWVPYAHPFKNRVSQYWTDFIINTEDFGILVVEIKPDKEIKAIVENKRPKMTGRKKKKTFLYETKMFEINKAKWIAARDYCEKKGWKFIQLSEKDLKSVKIPFL